ncbi:hypothetical protein AVEN_261202-1, partial [Araneus ventricosus]
KVIAGGGVNDHPGWDSPIHAASSQKVPVLKELEEKSRLVIKELREVWKKNQFQSISAPFEPDSPATNQAEIFSLPTTYLSPVLGTVISAEIFPKACHENHCSRCLKYSNFIRSGVGVHLMEGHDLPDGEALSAVQGEGRNDDPLKFPPYLYLSTT